MQHKHIYLPNTGSHSHPGGVPAAALHAGVDKLHAVQAVLQRGKIKIGFGERMNEDEANFQDSYIYANTSATPEGEIGQTGECPGIGQSFPYANAVIENIVVLDGVITIGANGGPSSHTFFNDVRLLISGAAPGFDYASAYKEILDGVDQTAAKPAEVVAVALYDLNGRRIITAQRGVMIVKKYMSDGTVRVEKVVKR